MSIAPHTEIGHLTCQFCEDTIPVWVGGAKGNRLVTKCPGCGSRATAGPRPDREMKAAYLAENSDDESEDDDTEENTLESGEEDAPETETEEETQPAIGAGDAGDSSIARNDDGIPHGTGDDDTGAGADTGAAQPSSKSDSGDSERRSRRGWGSGRRL